MKNNIDEKEDEIKLLIGDLPAECQQ